MTRPLRVLFVVQASPPSILSAARRTAGLTKHLARLGHEVTVVSSLSSGGGEGVQGAARTIRTRDLLLSNLNWRRESFGALASEEAGGAYEGTPSRLAEWVVPDLGLVTWVPFALARSLGLAKRGRFDCAITSAPPHSTHLIGRVLQRAGIPWIADVRDGWGFQSSRPAFATGALRGLDRVLERRLLQAADLCVGVTEPISADLRERLGVEALTLTNGYDPDELEGVTAAAADGLLDPQRHSLVYTGTMAYSGLSPEPLLGGVRALRERDPELAGRLELVFAGPLSGAERELIEAGDLSGLVRSVGTLARPQALALQRAADGLVVITQGRSSIATGKLYEYLASGRPVLVLGEGTAAARIVEDAGAGLATSASDPASIAEGIAAIARHDGAPDAARIERYSYAWLAAQLAEAIERLAELG